MKFILSFLLLASFKLLAQTSYVAPTEILMESGYQIGISGDYFITSKKLDVDGNEIESLSGDSFHRIQGDIFAQYGLTKNLQIGGGVVLRRNNSLFTDSSNSEENSETSTGVESTYATFTYAFPRVERIQYVLEGLFRFRPFTNDESTAASQGNLILGDDGNAYSAGFGATYTSQNKNVLSGRVGYRNPGTELSGEIYWQLEGALAWSRISLIGGVNGTSSLNNSPYTDSPSERPDFYTGGTSLYNSVNREFIAPYGGVNFALGKTWRIEFKGSQVVSGRSTDLGTIFGLSLIRRVEDKEQNRPDRTFQKYDFEASVTKVSPKKNFVVIDKGISDDVKKGMRIDLYEFDYVGGNVLLARGVVVQAKSDTSIVKISQRYNQKRELKEGILARGSFR